jgi:type I restriction enzyme, S subunit
VTIQWAPDHVRYRQVPFKFVMEPVERPVPDDAGVVTAYRDGQVTLRANRRLEGYTEAANLSSYQGVEPGDLVVHGLDILAGAVGVSDSHGAMSPVVTVCRPLDGADPHFVAYVIRAQAASGFTQAMARGIRQRSADFRRWETLADLPIPLPPPEEQRRIAEYLDTEVEQVRALSAHQNRLARLAWQRFLSLREGLLHARELAAGHSAGNGWRLSRIWIETRNHDRRRVPLNAEERGPRQGQYPYYGANGIVDHVDDHLFEGKMVLVGEDGAPFFEPDRDVAWVAEGRYWVNNHAHVLEAVGVLPEFLCEVLNVTDYSKYITGSTRDKLTQDDLSAIPVPVPPREEQLAIVNRLTHARQVVEQLRDATQRELKLLDERREALITAAVTGQMAV